MCLVDTGVNATPDTSPTLAYATALGRRESGTTTIPKAWDALGDPRRWAGSRPARHLAPDQDRFGQSDLARRAGTGPRHTSTRTTCRDCELVFSSPNTTSRPSTSPSPPRFRPRPTSPAEFAQAVNELTARGIAIGRGGRQRARQGSVSRRRTGCSVGGRGNEHGRHMLVQCNRRGRASSLQDANWISPIPSKTNTSPPNMYKGTVRRVGHNPIRP